MISSAALQRRIAILEATAKPHSGPPPQTHIVHGETSAMRAEKIADMIERGEAVPSDIFLLIVSPGEV